MRDTVYFTLPSNLKKAVLLNTNLRNVDLKNVDLSVTNREQAIL